MSRGDSSLAGTPPLERTPPAQSAAKSHLMPVLMRSSMEGSPVVTPARSIAAALRAPMEIRDHLNDVGLLVFRQFRIDGQRQDVFGRPFRHGKRPFVIPEVVVAVL